MADLPCPPSSLLVRPTNAPLSPAFVALCGELDRARGRPTLARIERSLGDATLDLADVLPHTASDRGTYVRTLVHATDRYQVLVMCWLPGQMSPVHDHGDSACGVRVVQGAATETLYAIAPDGFADPIAHRVFLAGDVVVAADEDVHTLGNLVVPGRERWPVALVTVHVYAPALTNSRKYPERMPAFAAACSA
jgi:cysteine dioxygenase